MYQVHILMRRLDRQLMKTGTLMVDMFVPLSDGCMYRNCMCSVETDTASGIGMFPIGYCRIIRVPNNSTIRLFTSTRRHTLLLFFFTLTHRYNNAVRGHKKC